MPPSAGFAGAVSGCLRLCTEQSIRATGDNAKRACAVDNVGAAPYPRAPAKARQALPFALQVCPDGGIGRRTVFRWRRSQGRGGSSPLLGTICSHQNVPKHCKNGGILPFLTSSSESEVLFCSALFQRLWGPRLGAPAQKAPTCTKVRPPNEPQCAGNQRFPSC